VRQKHVAQKQQQSAIFLILESYSTENVNVQQQILCSAAIRLK